MEVINIPIPRKLAMMAQEKGVDVEDLIINALISRLNLDPDYEYTAHAELARYFLDEGKNLVNRDPVQASEKLYKAAEEAVKALAIKLNLNEAREAVSRGRWTATLLFNAVDELSERLGMNEVRWWWESAWFLHVEGFHEARLSSGNIVRRVSDIEALVNILNRFT